MIRRTALLVLATMTSFSAALAGLVPLRSADAEEAVPVRELEIIVDGTYRPSRLVVREGEPVRLRFIRHDESSCTREVVLPWLGLRRELPPHTPVVFELPPMKAGEYEFRCGMNMVRGTLIVEAP